MAAVASIFGGMNVLLEWALQVDGSSGGGTDTMRDKIGRATVFALYRDVGAALLLLVLSMFLSPSQWRLIHCRDARLMLQIFACGLMGIGGQLPFIVGIAVIGEQGADTAAIFQPMSPVATISLAVLLGAERASISKLVAILFVIGGAVLVVDFASVSADSLVGVACLLLNVILVAGWLALQKLLLLRGIPFLPLIALTYAAGAICVMLLAVPIFGGSPALFAVNGRDGIALAYSVVLSSALCYFMLAWASQHLDPSHVSLWQVLQPITTAVLSLIFLHEVMTLRQIGGGALIAVGLVVSCVASLREERRSRATHVTMDTLGTVPDDLHQGTESQEPYERMDK